MKLTTIIALAIIAGNFGAHVASAQQLRTASPPAELPPSSYQGRQYVDSRGCVYIRAGIDGLVNWVPRVERNRRQVCGFQPTQVARSATLGQRTTGTGPELITLPAADRPAASTAQSASAPTTSAPAAGTRIVTQQKPRRATPPVPIEVSRPATASPPQPVRRVTQQTVRPSVTEVVPVSPRVGTGPCAGLSEVSRQYTNSSGVRCGPQPEPPITYGPQSSRQLPADTRVLPAHLYQERQLTKDIETPRGYRPVWQDDRLNPRRAEQDLYPRAASSVHQVAEGYVRVPNSGERFNPSRAQQSALGDARMAQVWTDTVPRKLRNEPAPQTITVKQRAQQTSAQLGFLAPETSEQLARAPRYVRAEIFADPTAAQEASRRLSATGLPVRLGRTTRNGQPFKVVLAGPFYDAASASAGLATVRRAGFSAARLSK